jgi:hypothetical protein
MHRQIMNAPADKVVHHEDGNGLNNTKENLQIVTIGENNRCSRKRGRLASSKYKGVSFVRGKRKWRAQVSHNGKYKHIGYFETQEQAARAYDEAAKIYHGKFAILNFEQEETKQDGRTEEQINRLRAILRPDLGRAYG